MSQINQKIYNQILENIPIICVDGILINDDNQVLFLKRENEPAKNEWWFPGGRLLKNEKLEDSIVRKVKEETNLDVEIVRYVGTTETIFNTGPFNIPVHTVNFTFQLKLVSTEIKIDNLHSEYIWSNKIKELKLNKEIFNLINNLEIWKQIGIN
jgi:colanic acid biosynthesis protein WcaH